MRSLRGFAISFVVLLIFVAGPGMARFYTDWLWFGELGYQFVYSTILRSQGTLFTAAFAFATAWLVLNLRLAARSLGHARPVFTTRDGIEVPLPGRKQVQALTGAAAVVLGAVAGFYVSGQWEQVLAWWYAVPFGDADPLLGRDTGFYVFTLPFLRLLHGLGQVLVVLAALGAGGLYLLSGSLTSGFPARLSMTTAARRHLALLAAAFLLLLAAGAWLHRFEFLVQRSDLINGATYADVHGRMPAALLLVVAAVIGAVLAVMQALTPRNWPIPVAVGLFLLVSVGGEAYSSLLQRFMVSPNEQARETPYIQHNIVATRRAYGLDGVEQREISGDARLTRDDIARNASTLQNVRLWDHQPLLDTFGQLQEIRTYYDFKSVDNDRYRINGQLRQVMLSARELNSASLQNRTWVNERLFYTHGYGLTLGPVNQVTEEGLPVLFVRNMPPETEAGLTIDEPSLYFGELSNDYVIVGTNGNEFHYPRGESNEETRYSGRGGVAIGSLWRQLLFAMRFRAYQIILSEDIGAESRILFNRNITERVSTLAPFLSFDQDPYLVLADGRLYWIYDAYTTTAQYPYSTVTANRLNYIRNSVKIVIDAYHGTTTLYLADQRDPIAATYARMFPNLFKPLADMPAALREHVRYPETIFSIQSQVFATYHMTQPGVFYNREDQWDIPALDEGGEGRPMEPYYTIMRLPGEKDTEFIQMLPFTPRQKDNLAAWLVARSDGDHYGKLGVFVFPKQKQVFGPRQVVSRIAQDQVISPQVTLWNQQGSQVLWGTLMVIPIEESLIYVRPLYLRASGGRIPELTRVIVAYENRIVMEDTLEAGLARLFGTAAPPAASPQDEIAGGTSTSPPSAESTQQTPAPGDPETAALAAEARGHYDRAILAQRAGDWARYGEEIRLLGEVLARMRTP